MVKQIPLINSAILVTVSDADFEWLSQYRWRAKYGRGSSPYFYAWVNKKLTRLSRLIMGDIPTGLFVDHINGDTSDNRRENLRLVTPLQSAQNTTKHKDNTSGYKGVSKTYDGKWCAIIHVDGKNKYLGRFLTPEEAYAAYCEAGRKYRGEYFRG